MGEASPIEDNPAETKQHGKAAAYGIVVIGMGLTHVRDQTL